MVLSLPRARGRFILALVAIIGLPAAVWSQEKPPATKPIDLDRELASGAPQDRGKSYYHYALSKWFEDEGDLPRALTEMNSAMKFDPSSATLRIELATILERMGRFREALEEAREASRIDPENPEPHWILANLYLRSQARDRSGKRESLKSAVEELEKMRDTAPRDERAHYALGGAYFELGETEKGIRAYEAFQELVPAADAGYVAIAKSYERAGNIDKATDYLQKALKSRPDSAETMMLLATMYSRQGKHREAIPLFKKLLELSNENPAVKRQLGATLVEAGEHEEAARILEELTRSVPQDKDARVLLARARLGQRQYGEAIEIFKAVLVDAPDNLEAAFYLGTAYEQSGHAAEAVRVFSDLVSRTRDGSEEYKANRLVFQQHLAAAYQDTGEYGKAIALYEEMIKSDPESAPRLYFLLINAYRVNRQLDKAVSVGKQQYERNPNDANITLVYARSLADAGKTKEGTELLQRALMESPSNIDLYVNLSQIYLQAKKYSEAEKILRRAADRKMDGERVRFQLATVYERQKEFDRAETLFRDLLKENPKNATVLNYIGYMLADRGVRLDEAVRYVEQALEIEPNNGAYLDSLGWAYFKLNELEKAEKYLLRAAELVKNDPVIQDHLGDLYFKAGNLERARDYWSKSVEIGTEPEETEKVRDKLQNVQELLRRQKRR
jgi:tetratricopeptide (TPR) repeat protein